MEFEAHYCFETCRWKFCVLNIFGSTIRIKTRILRTCFQLFSGQDLTMEFVRSFSLDVSSLGGVQRLIYFCAECCFFVCCLLCSSATIFAGDLHPKAFARATIFGSRPISCPGSRFGAGAYDGA